jgi:nicotinamidase-related amidase
LHELNTNTVVICGCNFPNCPRTTIYEASERDFRVVLITDATSGIYERGLRELDKIGVELITSNDCVAALK